MFKWLEVLKLYIHKYSSIARLFKFLLFCLGFYVSETDILAENAPNIKWVKNFGGSYQDVFASITETSDGGFVAVGNSYSSDIPGLTDLSTTNYTDAVIVKFDSSGKQLWAENFGGLGLDYFFSVVETSDKGFVTVGNSNSADIEGLANLGSDDAIIVKYDENGKQLWYKSFGGSNNDYFRSVIEINDSELIVVGYSNSSINGLINLGGYDAVIVKFDSSGKQLWTKNFGGLSNDYFYSVVEINDGGLVAVGWSDSSDIEDFSNLGRDDAIVVKCDSLGNKVWVKNFGGSGADYFRSNVEINDGGFVSVGWSASTNIEGLTDLKSQDAIIVKYNSNGDKVWVKNFGGSSEEYFYSVIEVKDGGFIAVGFTRSEDIAGLTALSTNNCRDAIIIKYDSEGNQLWVRNFGGSNNDYFYDLLEMSDKGLIVVGISYSVDVEGLTALSGVEYSDVIIVKFKETSEGEIALDIAMESPTLQNINNARILINSMSESIEKDQLQITLNNLIPSDISLIPENNTSNIDIYVLSNNSLSLSLINSSITFDDFSGVEDLTLSNALSFTINSSNCYNVSTSLVGNIVSNKGNILDKSIFNLRANGDTNYKNYSSSSTLILFANQSAGNNITHKVDIMLKGNVAHTADVYKAMLKVMVEQV